MNKAEQKLLVEAWEEHGRILSAIKRLAARNVSLAYGVIRTGETIIDMQTVAAVRREMEKQTPPKPDR